MLKKRYAYKVCDRLISVRVLFKLTVKNTAIDWILRTFLLKLWNCRLATDLLEYRFSN